MEYSVNYAENMAVSQQGPLASDLLLLLLLLTEEIHDQVTPVIELYCFEANALLSVFYICHTHCQVPLPQHSGGAHAYDI